MPRTIHTILRNFHGKTISVAGGEVSVDDTGHARDITDEQADKLLAGRNWYDGERKARAPRTREGVKATPIVVDRKGQQVEPPPTPQEPDTTKEIDPPPPPADDENAADEGDSEPYDGPVDPDGNPVDEWPDPKRNHSAAYLRLIADAYQVEYNEETSKRKLVADIHAAMYE